MADSAQHNQQAVVVAVASWDDVSPETQRHLQHAAHGSGPVLVSHPSEMKTSIMREEWTDDATETVLDLWGAKHLAMGRGKLRRRDWEDVATKLNSVVLGMKSWLQCKNKIDSIKKKYKATLNQRTSGSQKRDWSLYEKVERWLQMHSGKTDETEGDSADELEEAKATLNSSGIHPEMQDETQIAMEEEEQQHNQVDQEEHQEPPGKARPLKRKKSASVKGRDIASAIRDFAIVYEKAEISRQVKLFEIEQAKMTFWRDLEVQKMHVQLEAAKIIASKPCCHSAGSGPNQHGTDFPDNARPAEPEFLASMPGTK